MADAVKTYSESEHLAILSDRVAQETASISTERTALVTERDELANKLDIAESAKTAAESRSTEIQTEFDAFKSGVDQEREAAARKGDRVTKIREAAKHLKDEFFEDEARITRIVAMDDAGFEGYLLDLGASAIPAGTATAATAVPRETAMVGQPVDGADSSVGRSFLMRRYAPTTSAKGA